MHEQTVIDSNSESARAAVEDHPSQSLNRLLLFACAAILSALFAYIAVRSLPVRIELDSPIMLYTGFLMDRYHEVPYRDWFDMNLPGTYFIFSLLGKITGYSDFWLHIADLAILIVTMAATWFAAGRFGKFVAICSGMLFGIIQVAGGPELSLQREVFIVALVSVLMALLSRWRQRNILLLSGIAGLLIGCSATIKPQMLLLWPIVLFFLLRPDGQEKWRNKRSTGIVAASLLGLLIPIGLTFGYLWNASALTAFSDVARNYWPLYGAMDGQHRPIEGAARIWYLIAGYFGFCHLRLWVLLAAMGSAISLRMFLDTHDVRQDANPADVIDDVASRGQQEAFLFGTRRLLYLYIAIAVFFSMYPVFSGQFWGYHGLPLLYCTVILSSLCFMEPPASTRVPRYLSRARLAMMAGLLAAGVLYTSVYTPANGRDVARADEIAAYLTSNLRPGDTVQPLDWTTGAAHAMLIARARNATRFIYDFHFYHHVSKPYIQSLRQQFIAELKDARPRFIIEITGRRHWPIGDDTTRSFPALRRILIEDYTPVKRGNGYVISERNQVPQQQRSAGLRDGTS